MLDSREDAAQDFRSLGELTERCATYGVSVVVTFDGVEMRRKGLTLTVPSVAVAWQSLDRFEALEDARGA